MSQKELEKHNKEAQAKLKKTGATFKHEEKSMGTLRVVPTKKKKGSESKTAKTETTKPKKKKALSQAEKDKRNQTKRENAASKEQKGIIKKFDEKMGRPTLRKKIADVAKKAWKKTGLRKKLVKTIKAGIVKGSAKIKSARTVYKKAAAEYKALKANTEKGTAKWRAVKAKQVAMERARGKYRNLRMGKGHQFRRKVFRRI